LHCNFSAQGPEGSGSLQRIASGLSVFHLERLHPGLGNKAYKLAPSLLDARSKKAKTLVSVGGAWSNHLYALAILGSKQGFKTAAFVREVEAAHLSAMLKDVQSWGMQLHFLSRSDYRRRDDPAFINQLMQRYPAGYFIPEGGSNALGVSGAEGILQDLVLAEAQYDHLVLPVGTGGTMAGILRGLKRPCHVVGVSALKGVKQQHQAIQTWAASRLSPGVTYELVPEVQFGGYASCPPILIARMRNWEAKFGFDLEPVYGAKALSVALSMKARGALPGETLLLHTGGLQGRRGFPELSQS